MQSITAQRPGVFGPALPAWGLALSEWFRGVLLVLGVLGVWLGGMQLRAAPQLRPNLDGQMGQAQRYYPEGEDFVITNGGETFNRPLYCGKSGGRVDAGDVPELSLYFGAHAGNLRLGVGVGETAKWLDAGSTVIARYRPGEMVYEVRDSLLGRRGRVFLEVCPLAQGEGVILRAQGVNTPREAVLFWAFGGVDGRRGRRGGDVGGEEVPVSEFFKLRPQACAQNRFVLRTNGFEVQAGSLELSGLASTCESQELRDARDWPAAGVGRGERHGWALRAPLGCPTPVMAVVVGRALLVANQPWYVGVGRAGVWRGNQPEKLAGIFIQARERGRALRQRVAIETPDPYLNAGVGALNVAADALWDETSGSVLHGAVAWRMRLAGWRGPSAMDALGWHERAEKHLGYWARRQNTNPVTAHLPSADESANLATCEAGLHSNGDLANSHYDMNLAWMDMFLRHELWTGDLGLARELWPTLERHLAWERRLFRRPFGPDAEPLYEGYAAIWASDNLAYNGGGAAHASALNYWHNRMAAELARKLGMESLRYEGEAGAIQRAMHHQLWLKPQGWMAEYKDWLGLQRVHPDAAVWTFYHTLDSEVVSPQEAWQMTRQVQNQLPRVPVVVGKKEAKPEGYLLSSSEWLPYQWSLNNVVFAENAHAALALWQAGRPQEAWKLLHDTILVSQYLGICPGNIGTLTDLDVYRREAQRDFGDGAGVFARAVIEGLFGVHPDGLQQELFLEPGLPESWEHAALHHPDLELSYGRSGRRETWRIKPRFSSPMALRLVLAARRDSLRSVLVNGKPSPWSEALEFVGRPRIEIKAAAASEYEVEVLWRGREVAIPPREQTVTQGEKVAIPFSYGRIVEWEDPQRVLQKSQVLEHRVDGWVEGVPGPRTCFARVQQGVMEWWWPVEFNVEKAGTGQSCSGGKEAASMKPGRMEPICLQGVFNARLERIFDNEYRSPRSPFVSLSVPKQGIGGWAGACREKPLIDDGGLRAVAEAHQGRVELTNGICFLSVGKGESSNVVFVSCWRNFPAEQTIPLSGRARRLLLLTAGTTGPMQSRVENGEVLVRYADGSTARLALVNPDNWWPIEQDYFTDDFQFRRSGPVPPRLDLKTGAVRYLTPESIKGRGGNVPGGAASVLELRLDSDKSLSNLTIRCLSNEVIIGLIGATLEREP